MDRLEPLENLSDKIERAGHGDEGFASDRPKCFLDAGASPDGSSAMSLLKSLAEFLGLDCAQARNRGDDQPGGGWSQVSGHLLPRLVAQHA